MNRERRQRSSPEAIAPELDEWIEIGKVVAAQGLKGEMRVYPSTDFPERFEQPGRRWLRYPGKERPEPVELTSGYFLPNKGLYVVQLAQVSDRDGAEALRGCIFVVPQSDRPVLEEDEFHVRDLIGLEVFDARTGTAVGTVVDLIPTGNDLLVVLPHGGFEAEGTAGPIYIPFVREIVPVVDLEAGRLEIEPPEGLLEVNARSPQSSKSRKSGKSRKSDKG
jgi:16S rRNA processing protein RimM